MNDKGIDALVPALKMCDNLNILNVNGNPSITTRGWQHLATILENPNSNIIDIDLTNNMYYLWLVGEKIQMRLMPWNALPLLVPSS